MLSKKTTKGLSIFTLSMLIKVSIDSIRNLPATALFGTTLIFFCIFAAIVFLIPTALVSAELASKWTKRGGIFYWVEQAFGEKMAFLAIWLQWINTMVWYPTILAFIAGTAAFLIDPKLAENKIYLVSVILIVFWTLTLLNLRGINTSAKFASFCAVVGMIIPMLLIITIAGVWLFSGNPTQIHINAHSLIPQLNHTDSWISLTAIMAAFLGMELATVQVNNLDNAQKAFPRALLLSVSIILTTMILGSLSIALLLPKNKINLVDGVMQAFHNFFQIYHIGWLIPVITIMLLIGSLGGMINWIISPAKGLLQAAQHGYLPKFLTRENNHGVARNLLLTQAILVSFVCLAFLLMPSVNATYWLLTDLSTELYMLMYALLFISALVIHYKYKHQPAAFTIPLGSFGKWMVCGLGLIGSAITVTIGFFPPSSIEVGGKLHYDIIFTSGIIVMILPVSLFYVYRFRKKILSS